MIDFSSILNSVLTWIIIGLLGLLISSVWKLIKTINKIGDFMVKTELRTSLSEDRHDVHDALISDLVGHSINTERIAKGLEERPPLSSFIKMTHDNP